ncbi:hypothetical protein IDVR_09990 [Intrasporangium sp. DVR]
MQVAGIEVGSPERDDAQGNSGAGQDGCHLADRPVAPADDHELGALAERGSGLARPRFEDRRLPDGRGRPPSDAAGVLDEGHGACRGANGVCHDGDVHGTSLPHDSGGVVECAVDNPPLV